MELHPPDQLNAVPEVADVLQRYLNRLPLTGERRAMLFADALAHGGSAARALTRVHAALAAHAANGRTSAAHATIGARLRLATGDANATAHRSLFAMSRGASGWKRHRDSREARWRRMHGSAAGRWPARLGCNGRTNARGDHPAREGKRDPGDRWRIHASRRRLVLAGLIVAQTRSPPSTWRGAALSRTEPLEIAILVLFAILFAWISAGFWTAHRGFLPARARQGSLRDFAPARGRSRSTAPMRAPRS